MPGRSVQRSTFVLFLTALAGVVVAGCGGAGTPAQRGGMAAGPASSAAGDPAGAPATDPSGGSPTDVSGKSTVSCQVMVIMGGATFDSTQHMTDFDAIATIWREASMKVVAAIAEAPGTPGAREAEQVAFEMLELSKQFAAHPATLPDGVALKQAFDTLPPCDSGN